MSHFLFDNVLPPGTQLLGRYIIEAQVARGGSSTIYRALDERLDRVVCIKVYRGPLGQGLEGAAAGVDRTVFSLFRREAFALSRLQHPNTLRIYDVGVLESEARPFQVTEYLDGGNLEQHVRSRGPLSPPEALDILGPIAAAAVEAHGFGLVHRDIKPSNILFARAGSTLVPKLADFGIASSTRSLGPAEGSDAITLSGMVYSPHWAAPEQLVSKPVGPSTDVYALALLTLFMLTGSTPFYVENVLGTFLERVRGTDAVEAYFEHCSFSPALRAVLLEALGPDPSTRLASATEFAQRVGRALGAPAPFAAPGPLAFGPPGAGHAAEPVSPAAVLTGAAASAVALASPDALPPASPGTPPPASPGTPPLASPGATPLASPGATPLASPGAAAPPAERGALVVPHTSAPVAVPPPAVAPSRQPSLLPPPPRAAPSAATRVALPPPLPPPPRAVPPAVSWAAVAPPPPAARSPVAPSPTSGAWQAGAPSPSPTSGAWQAGAPSPSPTSGAWQAGAPSPTPGAWSPGAPSPTPTPGAWSPGAPTATRSPLVSPLAPSAAWSPGPPPGAPSPAASRREGGASGGGAAGPAGGRMVSRALPTGRPPVSLTFDSDEGKISPLAFREIGSPGGRPVRLAPPRERWDLTLQAEGREPLRLRVTLLVVQGRQTRLHLKGLNCFVRLPNSQHASAAVFADGDGSAQFLSMGRDRLAQCRWGWGSGDRTSAMSFAIPDEALLTLPWPGSRVALALAFDDYPDVIVLQAS